MSDYIQRQRELRANAWEQAKSLLDHASSENRDLDAAEQEQYDRIMEDLDKRGSDIARYEADMAREERASEAMIPQAMARTESRAVESDEQVLRAMFDGERRSATFEARNTANTATTATNAGVIEQSFYDRLQEILRYTGPAFDPSVGYTRLVTAGGEDIKVPRQTAFSVATATAETAQFAVSNPTTESFLLKSLKVGVLLKTSRELLSDASIDLVGFLARQAGEAVGYATNGLLATGTGTVQPRGIFNAAGSGTQGTATAFTADNLIDLVFSLDSAVVSRPSVGFQMNRQSLAAVRKLKDGDGTFLYQFADGGRPTILGYPVFENPFAPAIGSAAKSVIFGDMSSYHVRQVGGIEVARSDDFAFDTDEIVWRVSTRIWGDLGQSTNVKYFQGAAI